jgi:hypothetical protein
MFRVPTLRATDNLVRWFSLTKNNHVTGQAVMNTLRLRLSVVNGLDQPLAPANLDEIALLDTSAQKRPPGVVAEAPLFDVDPVAPGNHEPIRRASQPSDLRRMIPPS